MISTVLPHHILEVGLPVAEEVDEHGLLHGGERYLDCGPGEVAGVVSHGGPLHLLARPEQLLCFTCTSCVQMYRTGNVSPVQFVYRCTELVMYHQYSLCTEGHNWLCLTYTACVLMYRTGYVSSVQLAAA